MAFDNRKFAPIGGNASGVMAMYAYRTTDTLEEVEEVGYFEELKFKLDLSDMIVVRNQEGNTMYRVLIDKMTVEPVLFPSNDPRRADERRVIESLNLVSTLNSYDDDPVTKVDETFAIEFPGDYKVSIGLSGGVSSTNRSLVVGVFINGVLVDEEYSMEMKDVDNNNWPMKTVMWSLLPGEHTVQVLFGRRGGGGGSVVHLKNVRIIIES